MVMAALSQTLLKAAHKNTYQQRNPSNRRAQTENTNPPVEIAADWKTPLLQIVKPKNALTQTSSVAFFVSQLVVLNGFA